MKTQFLMVVLGVVLLTMLPGRLIAQTTRPNDLPDMIEFRPAGVDAHGDARIAAIPIRVAVQELLPARLPDDGVICVVVYSTTSDWPISGLSLRIRVDDEVIVDRTPPVSVGLSGLVMVRAPFKKPHHMEHPDSFLPMACDCEVISAVTGNGGLGGIVVRDGKVEGLSKWDLIRLFGPLVLQEQLNAPATQPNQRK